jgi:hypothetical protein
VIKKGLAFSAVCASMIGILAWTVTAAFGDAAADRAVWVSAVIAVVVQVGSFAVIWPIVTKNPIAGWGVGSLIRFAAVLIHGFAGVKVLALPIGPALLSLVAFLFVTMLVEPFFLKR